MLGAVAVLKDKFLNSILILCPSPCHPLSPGVCSVSSDCVAGSLSSAGAAVGGVPEAVERGGELQLQWNPLCESSLPHLAIPVP